MNPLSHIPLVRLVIPLLAGVLLYAQWQTDLHPYLIVTLSGGFVICGLIIYRFFLQHYHLRFLFGINILLFLTFAGYTLAQGRYHKNLRGHFSTHAGENTLLRLKLTEPVAEKASSYQIKARVTHVVHVEGAIETSGKLITWLEKDSLAATLKYGDIIYMDNNVQEVREPLNPHAFNFKQFLAYQNIFHQAYRRSGQWYTRGENHGNRIISFAHRMRQTALHTLEQNNLKGREFAVASALLLGYREYLDEDLQREFAGAGAMHILCVSGLHVGIIFLALNLIFGFLTKLPRGKILKTLVIISLIWFYAAITGFSPSVMRASTMFSFVAIGQSFQRQTNIYNTLAASALLLIILDPFIVKRIGFQLSYIAVISIVWLQPKFYKLMYFKNPILDHAWGIITVSLAAQLGTGPLALYYFNQFPNYFLLTNLVVIPLTGLIIKSGIIMFIVSPVEILGTLTGQGLAWIILVLHNAVRLIEGLPFSVSNHVFITLPETLLIFALICLAGVCWLAPRKWLAFSMLVVGLILTSSVSLRSIRNQQQLRLVVYHVPQTTAIDLIAGRNCHFLGPRESAGNLDFHLSQNRLKSGIRPNRVVITDSLPEAGNGFVWHKPFLIIGQQTLVIADAEHEIPDFAMLPFAPDIVLLTENTAFDLAKHASHLAQTTIIIDSSSDFRKTAQWTEQCNTLGLQCWSVRQQGAYVLNLQ